MNAIRLWFKKDLKEIRWYGIAWALFLVIKFRVLTTLHENGGIWEVIVFLQGITMVFEGVVGGRIILQDPIQGARAYWMTRPFSIPQWIAVKSFTLFFLILLPSTLVDLAPCFLSELPITWTVEILTWQLFVTIPFILGIAILSLSIERKREFYGLATFLTLGWALFQSFPSFEPLIKSWNSGIRNGNISEWATLDILQGLFLFFGLSGVVVSFLRFKSRWIHLTLLFLAVAVLPMGFKYGVTHSKINFFAHAESESQERLESKDPKKHLILIPHLAKDEDLPVDGGIEFYGEDLGDDAWIRPYSFESVDKNVQYLAYYSHSDVWGLLGRPEEVHMHSISHLLNNATFKVKKTNPAIYGILSTFTNDRGKSKTVKGALKIEGLYELCHYREAFRISNLGKAVLESRGIMLEWLSSKTELGNSITVVREVRWENPFRIQPSTFSDRSVNFSRRFAWEKPSKLTYVLYNEPKNEFVLPQPLEIHSSTSVRSNQYTNRLHSVLKTLEFLNVDEAWIKESKLVAFETEVEGRGKFEYSIPY